MSNIKESVKKILYSVFTSSLFFGIFFLFYNSNSEIGITALILLLLLFFPLILSGLWLGYIGIVLPILFSLAIYYIDPMATIILLIVFIIPSVLLVVITTNNKIKQYCSPLIFIIFYITLCMILLLNYFSYKIDSSIYNYLYDLFTFLSISIISNNKDVFQGVDTTNTIKIISFIIPALSSFLWIAWINMNYKLALLIINRTDVLPNNNYTEINVLPTWYSYIVIIFAISVFLINKIFVDAENLCYTLYNIFEFLFFWPQPSL